MRKVIYQILVLWIISSSCSLLMSKDEKLTNERWILEKKTITNFNDGETRDELIYYKRSEEKLVLDFSLDGTLHITEDNGQKFATIAWNWKSENKEYLQFLRGGNYGDFHVIELNGSTLTLSKFKPNSDIEIMIFKHQDDKNWDDDETVELMNKLRNNKTN